MAKKYNTTEVNVKKVDVGINRETLYAICSTNHLTPQSEAAMENLLVPGSVPVPKINEIITRNSPDFDYECPRPWRELELTPVDDEFVDADEPTAAAYDFD